MKIALIALPLLILVGCATTPKEIVKVETITVKVPVYTACAVKVPVQPAYVTQNIPANGTLYEKMQALLSDRILSLVYEKELEGALVLCTKE